jgi:hypothetical protein
VIGDELARGALREVVVPLVVPPLDFVAAYVEAPNSAHLAAIATIAQDCAGHKREL